MSRTGPTVDLEYEELEEGDEIVVTFDRARHPYSDSKRVTVVGRVEYEEHRYVVKTENGTLMVLDIRDRTIWFRHSCVSEELNPGPSANVYSAILETIAKQGDEPERLELMDP